MTKEEALFVLKIMVTADSVCAFCAGALVREFLVTYPEFKPQAVEAWKGHFDWYGDKAIEEILEVGK